MRTGFWREAVPWPIIVGDKEWGVTVGDTVIIPVEDIVIIAAGDRVIITVGDTIGVKVEEVCTEARWDGLPHRMGRPSRSRKHGSQGGYREPGAGGVDPAIAVVTKCGRRRSMGILELFSEQGQSRC